MRQATDTSDRHGTAQNNDLPHHDDADEATAAMTADLAARASATHLVVFQHGLLGTETDFANAQTLFRVHLASQHVYAHVAESNATRVDNWSATCDGIDCGAARLASEIVRLTASMPMLTKFSLVGHSMGGLYARYCIGILYARGFFDRIEPVNFVTVATPHLGNRRPQRGSVNLLYNAIAPRLFDRTGAQFALVDEASDETLALSRCVEPKYPHRRAYAACHEMDSVLFVRVASAAEPSADVVSRRCVLQNHLLTITTLNTSDSETPETTKTPDQTTTVACIDLTHAGVTLVVPDKAAATVGDWAIEIRPTANDHNAAGTTCVTLCLPRSALTAGLWQWVSAVSNAACGLTCRSSTSPSPISSTRPPLLACLARGQFLHALQLFRVRTLYATVFNDHTVPYSCAAVRAFNPYRYETTTSAAEAVALRTSPYYDHVLVRSVAQTPLLRHTLPLDVRLAATRKSTASFRLAKELASGEATPPTSANQATSATRSTDIEPPQPRVVASLTATLSSLFFTNGGTATATPVPVPRPVPFTDGGSLLLDHVDDAFTTDEARDTLRAMLVAVQSVGWRRVDVRLDSLLAHEMVIAKRADVTSATCDGGLDILHHLIDTFEL